MLSKIEYITFVIGSFTSIFGNPGLIVFITLQCVSQNQLSSKILSFDQKELLDLFFTQIETIQFIV